MDNANWLLSALAQTAGALVAIVGGFLVSRLVGLSSQRNGLLARVAALKKRLEAADHKESAARKELVGWEKDLLASSLLWDLVEAGGDSTKLNLDEHNTHTLIDEEVAECVRESSDAVTRAFAAFRASEVEYGSPDKVEEFASAHNLSIRKEDLRTFSAVYRHLKRNAPRPKSRTTGLFGIPEVPLIRNPTIDLLGGMTSMQEQQFDATLHNNMIADWKSASHGTSMLRHECESLQDSIEELGRPSGLAGSAIILAYLCASGVVVPLSLLPSEHLSVAGKWAVLGPFFVGLVALLWNLAWSIRHLGRGSKP